MALKVSVVATDRRVWTGSASIVVLPSVEGEIGIMTGHEPIMTLLGAGLVKITAPEEDGSVSDVQIQITGGFVSLYADELNVVADSADVV